jgi:predicted Fe-Mo cluster-binding NifX family protein
MSKIGVMMAADRADGQISSHFGKAEWVMVADAESGALEFLKNEAANGKSAVEIAIRRGLTELIFTEIGNGAFGHLRAAGIRGWVAPEQITGEQALRMFEQARLQPASAATKLGGGMSCCCSGQTSAESDPCCSH